MYHCVVYRWLTVCGRQALRLTGDAASGYTLDAANFPKLPMRDFIVAFIFVFDVHMNGG